MGSILTLRRLVGGQIGAKRGKLALLGGLRGTKVYLKEGLEGPNEAPSGAKSGTRDIDYAARGLSNGGSGAPQSILAS